MRDKKRLEDVYETLRAYHEAIPDIRFLQLMMDFFSWHYQNFNTDGFYVEDEDFLTRFKMFMKDLFNVDM